MTQVHEEISSFYQFISDLPVRNVLEIGTKMGGTFDLLCSVASNKKISVDLPGGTHGGWMMQGHPYLGDSYKKRDKYFRKKYKNVTMITGDSHEEDTNSKVTKVLQNGMGSDLLDILFIDGDHTFDGIFKDFMVYRNFLAPAGYIVLHDINDTLHHREIDVEVYKLWDYIRDTGDWECWEFNAYKHWAGIGVCKRIWQN